MAVGIKFQFNNLTDNLIVVWVANSNPTAEVGRQLYGPGNAVGQANGLNILTPDNLLPTVYTFKFYESSDGNTLGSLIDQWEVDASRTDTLIERFDYIVDGARSGVNPNWQDPVSGGNTITDQRLIGGTYSSLTVTFRGIGPRSSDEFIILDTGGIQLTAIDSSGTAETFIERQRIFIDYYHLVTVTQPTGPSAAGGYLDTVDISDPSGVVSLDATYFNKVLNCVFSQNVGTINLLPLGQAPNQNRILFLTHGTARYVKVQLATGDTIKYKGQDKNYFYLLCGEKLELSFKDKKGYVVDENINPLVGHRMRVDNKNLTIGHLTDGGESRIADYPRVIEALSSEQTCTYPQYDQSVDVTVGEITKTYYINRGKFAVNQQTGLFKWPDTRGYSSRTLNHYDGTQDTEMLSQGAGGVWAQQIIEHKHVKQNANSTKRGGSSDPSGEAKATPLGDSLGAQFNDETAVMGGAEQRVDSEGQYEIIYI